MDIYYCIDTHFFQIPPSFTVEGRDILDAILRELPEGPRYAVEVRQRS